MLERTWKENYKRISVTWVYESAVPDEIGKITYVEICEREINSQKDLQRWQERLQMYPLELVSFLDENEDMRNFKDILDDLKRCERFRIDACIKIVKKVKERLYLATLLGDSYLLKLLPEGRKQLVFDVFPDRKYQWVRLHSDSEDDIFTDTVLIKDKREMLFECSIAVFVIYVY
ncbi:hypothetical protein Ferp_0522 [Ferroglobus placidus DSM 10642]|uniref:Uncharacterized protein n=2 Tax=Ferroglobus placidus TaxID=54261 RepID=D3S363_FERPA|nr:hypothetical protein Ferp_0522 [Ferroglobus placidus DSM 10642]